MKRLGRFFASAGSAPAVEVAGPPRLIQGVIVRRIEAAGDAEGGWDFEVLIAQAGYSRDGAWFLPREVLAAAAPLFGDVQAFADHADHNGPSIKNLVGWHREVRMTEAGLVSTFAVSKSAEWFQQMAADALDRGIGEPFGFSFDVLAETEFREENGGLVLYFLKIVAVNSVDVVHKGRLSGALLGLAAAENSAHREIEMYQKLLAALKAAAPGLAAKLPDSWTPQHLLAACQEAHVFEALFKKLQAAMPSAAAALPEGWTPEQLLAAYETAGLDMSLQAADLVNSPAGDPPQGNGIPGPAADPPAPVHAVAAVGAVFSPDLAVRVAAIEGQNILNTQLTASALPDPVKERVRAQFTERGTFTEAQLTAALVAEARTMEQLTASGALQVAAPSVEVIRAAVDKKRGALDRLMAGDRQVVEGIAPYRFLSEAFLDIVGVPMTPGRFFAEAQNYHQATEDWNGIRRLAASLDTSSWGEAFGDSIRRALLKDFREDRFQVWKKLVSSVVPIKDFRTNRRVRLGGYGDLSTVAQQASYPTFTSPTDEEATYAVAKRGGIEDLTWEMIQNDDMGAILSIPKRLARAAQRTLNNFVFAFLSGNASIYDAVALFAAGHGGNTAANALTYANVIAGIKTMGQQTFYNESGVEVASQAQPKYLLHPTELMEEAFDITQSAVKVVANSDATQPSFINRLGVEPVWVPEFTDANDWFLVADPSLMDTIEIGFLDNQQEPELFIEDNPASGSPFDADKIRYKIRHVYGGAVLDYRGFYRGAPA